MALTNVPSPWMTLTIEQLKDMKDRYKLVNDIEKETQREQSLKKEKTDALGQTQMDAMKSTLPFLDRG